MMGKWIARKLELREGEWLATVLMFLYIVGVLGFYYILKPIRYGLFLKSFDADKLPYAYFLTAFLTGSIAALIFKLSRRFSAITFLTATNLGIIATLFYFRWAIGREITYLPYFYFVYVQVISVLSTAQFWLLAGYVFDGRQSKRIFPLLGAGAIVGGMAGSAVSGFFQHHLSVPAMILICIGTCTILIVLSQIAWRLRRTGADRPASRTEDTGGKMSDLLHWVFGSRHLLLIALLVFLTLIASQISDWQVSAAAEAAFGHLPKAAKELAINQVYGRFYFITNIIGISLQLLVTGFVVRRFGIGAAILFLPIGLLVSSLGVLAAPGLLTALLCLGSNSVFRYSINRAGLEILYLPLAPEMRKRIKVFIDVFVDRFGRAGAAVIILVLTSPYIHFGLRGTAAAIVALSAACVAAGLAIRKSYVEAFRQKLVRREVDLAEVTSYVTDPASLGLLTAALESAQERQILYALRLLQSARGFDFSRQLLPLLGHGSPLVREEAVRTLPVLPGRHEARVVSLLDDSAEDVRAAAVAYLATEGEEGSRRILDLLGHQRPDVRLAAARLSAERTGAGFRTPPELVRHLLSDEGEGSGRAKATAAWLAPGLPAPESTSVLRDLLRDPAPEVAGAAANAAATAGRTELLFDILPMLTRRGLRGAVREALVHFGPRIAGTLGDLLSDPQTDPALRREIPWILSRFSGPRAAGTLVENLGAADALLKYRVVKALSRIHRRNPALPGAHTGIDGRIRDEIRNFCELLALAGSLERAPAGGRPSLLHRALLERSDVQLEIVFRLLGLEYPQRDMYFAWVALQKTSGDRRLSAIEYLDNVLDKDLKSMLLPLLEELSLEQRLDHAHRFFGCSVRSLEDAVRAILVEADGWLKACALYEIGARRMGGLADVCSSMTDDRDPLIRETAAHSLQFSVETGFGERSC